MRNSVVDARAEGAVGYRIGALGRGCQSPTWRKTQARPRAGDDGGCCSPFSAERDSSGAAGLGGRIAVIRARWRRSSRRSWPADTRSPAETWTSSWPGRRTRTGESLTSWDPASWHGGETRRPAKPGRGSCRVPRSRRRAIRGAMRLFHESGQLAAAEQLINDAARDPRNDRTALLVLLVPIYQRARPHR